MKRYSIFILSILLLTACSHKPNTSNLAGAIPRDELPSPYGNPNNYKALGKTYKVMPSSKGYKEKGIASWYGKDFHGKRTSSGTPYDMHAYSAAHKTLPIPTYVRVTNLENGKNLILRVDDRGPFVSGRIIDLSYKAAHQLGVVGKGTAQVEVEALAPYQSLDRPKVAPTSATIANAPIVKGYEKLARQDVTTQTTRSPLPSNDTVRVQPLVSSSVISQSTMPTYPLDTNNNVSVNASDKPSLAANNNFNTVISAGHYLQLGAFSNISNAERLQARLRTDSRYPVNIHAEQGLYKVHIGPFSSLADAENQQQYWHSIGIETPKIVQR